MGYSAFASKLLRLPPAETSNNPCVGTYDVEVKKKERTAFKPFNVGAKRQEQIKFLTPA